MNAFKNNSDSIRYYRIIFYFTWRMWCHDWITKKEGV